MLFDIPGMVVDLCNLASYTIKSSIAAIFKQGERRVAMGRTHTHNTLERASILHSLSFTDTKTDIVW